jgi:hypothetical protein
MPGLEGWIRHWIRIFDLPFFPFNRFQQIRTLVYRVRNTVRQICTRLCAFPRRRVNVGVLLTGAWLGGFGVSFRWLGSLRRCTVRSVVSCALSTTRLMAVAALVSTRHLACVPYLACLPYLISTRDLACVPYLA